MRSVSSRATVALALCLAGGCLGEQGGRRSVLAKGDAVPLLGGETSGPAVVWTFRSKDCLTCNLANPAWVVRRLQTRSGGDFETVVVAVGETTKDERTLVEGFLASERISARVVMQSPRQHRRDFGPGPMPALYLANSAGVVRVAVPGSSAGSVANWDAVDVNAVVQAFLDALDSREANEDNSIDTHSTEEENDR